MSHPRPASTHRRLRVAVATSILAVGLAAAPGVVMAQGAPVSGVLGVHRGIMPTRQVAAVQYAGETRGSSGASGASSSGGATPPPQLSYQGGLAGAGVTSGAPQVYVVLWGTQWGTQGVTKVNGASYPTFSGDPAGVAPNLEAFYAGLGTNGETWSGVMTEYCQSSAIVTVATGATSCPVNAAHVGYPAGGALAGVWEDTSGAAPGAATQAQLAQEAEDAATHFGRTTPAANRNVQYVIVSPTGTNPNGFNTPTGGFCAWHDYSTDSLGNVNAVSGALAFTNLPYIPDAGYSCGANYVNPGSRGALDGVTVIASHEYAETLTDQYLGYGWYNSTYGEAADICAWAPLDANGGTNLALATGTFPVQGVYANDANGGAGGCALSHTIISDHLISLTNPGHQTSTLATPVRPVVIRASDRSPMATATSGISLAAVPTLRYRAQGLPTGLVINPTTGVISGAPRHAVSGAIVTITAIDASGNSGLTRFVWSVHNSITIRHLTTRRSIRHARARLRIRVTDTHAHARLVYAAHGLPRGLRINRHTGLIAGMAAHAGMYRVVVTVTDSLGARSSTTFAWQVR